MAAPYGHINFVLIQKYHSKRSEESHFGLLCHSGCYVIQAVMSFRLLCHSERSEES